MKKVLLFGLILVLTISTSILSETDKDLEYKAKFLLKLVKYVEWPDGKNVNASGTTVITIVGSSPIAAVIREHAKTLAGGIKVEVKEIPVDSDFTDAHIIFIPTKDTKELSGVLKRVGSSSILTVGDCEYFCNYGVMVNFFNDGGKVKFEVNRMTLGDAGLSMSSKLLKMAKLI